jgi:hypothetical protein
MTCTCGPWHLTGIREPCAKHPADVDAPLPSHNVDGARKTFPALSEEVRAFYRLNGNIASETKGDGVSRVPPELMPRPDENHPRPRKR